MNSLEFKTDRKIINRCLSALMYKVDSNLSKLSALDYEGIEIQGDNPTVLISSAFGNTSLVSKTILNEMERQKSKPKPVETITRHATIYGRFRRRGD